MRYFAKNEQELTDILQSAKTYKLPIIGMRVSGDGYTVEIDGEFSPDEYYPMKLKNADTGEYLSVQTAIERGERK